MTTQHKDQQEPSMEEILSSIRRIIADEEADEAGDEAKLAPSQEAKQQPAENGLTSEATEDDESEDVLELTKVVRDSGEVVDLKTDSAAAASEELAVAAVEETADDATEEVAVGAVVEEAADEPELPAAELDDVCTGVALDSFGESVGSGIERRREQHGQPAEELHAHGPPAERRAIGGQGRHGDQPQNGR